MFLAICTINIIKALIDGNVKPQGAVILQRTDQLTVYEVKDFEENICEIPISFEVYCRNIGSIEKMKNIGIIKERIAEILDPPEAIGIIPRGSKSKKAQAFQFFNQGKRPGDPEVKALGIKPNSTYRYFQGWKKTQDNRNNTA